MRIILGVRGFMLGIGAVCVPGSVLGSWLALRTPAPPDGCRDEVEFRSDHEGRFQCGDERHVMQVYPTGPTAVLVKCICPRAVRS